MSKNNGTLNIAAHGIECALIAVVGLFTYTKYTSLDKEIKNLIKRLDESSGISDGSSKEKEIIASIKKFNDELDNTNAAVNRSFEGVKRTFTNHEERIRQLETVISSINSTKENSQDNIVDTSVEELETTEAEAEAEATDASPIRSRRRKKT